MDVAMTLNAEGQPVRHIEPSLHVVSPMVDVVGMKGCGRLAELACPLVAEEDSIAPDIERWCGPCALVFKRLAALPMSRRSADHASCLARTRAVDAAIDSALESNTTDWTRQPRESIGPAFLAAVPRRSRSVSVSLIGLAAAGAHENDAGAAAENRDAFYGWHGSIIPSIEPKYVDVIVARWEAFTGQTAVLDG